MPEVTPSKYLVSAGWNDVPHLTEKAKRELLAGTPPHLRKARSLGIPSLGAGAVYPIEEDDILCDDFQLPRHFLRGFAMDPGWNRTAAICGAYDRETDCLYLYREYYRGQAEPTVHIKGIRAFGKWMIGCIDPAARGRSQIDGAKMVEQYSGEDKLKLIYAQNAVETGLQEVFERLSTGRIKVFRSMVAFLAEYRIYRRDEHGKIVKANDHLMDCMRYLVMTPQVLRPMPADADGPLRRLAVSAGSAHDPGMGY